LVFQPDDKTSGQSNLTKMTTGRIAFYSTLMVQWY